MIMRIPILKKILKSYTPSWQIMRSSALDRLPYLNFSHIRKVKDALGRCHDENGYLVSCTGGSGTGSPSTARGQATLSQFGQKPGGNKPTGASPGSQGKPSEKAPASTGQHDIKVESFRTHIKYSGGDSAFFASKDRQGDRIISGVRFSKDPKATAALIERALKDGPIAIPDYIANSPNGKKALAELQKDGKISLNTTLKDGHTIVKPGDGKKPESKPESKPEPKPAPKQEARPEPKPEPKPEQKPADGEVDVKRSGSFAAYRISDRVYISVASVQGGGRTLMGSNFSEQATSEDVAVAVYRVIKDGPLTFPDRMFANQKFREAIQNLEQLEKVVVNDSSNGRDKILYEMGPDGQPKDPQPSQKPRQSTRRHPTNTNAKDLPEFKPAKTTAEAVKRLAQHMPEGAAKVEYEGVPVEKMNSILKASEHILSKYGVEVKQMGFCEKSGAEYGICSASYQKEINYVQLRKSFVSDPQKYVKRDIGRMRANQAYNLIQTEKHLNRLKTDPNIKPITGQEEALENEKRRLEKKIEHIKSVDHWIVADAVEDPIYAVQAHECMHAVYYYHNLAPKFAEEMEKVDGWKIPLTEYATSKRSEFFAELGCAVTCGYKVHPKLFEAFQNTVRSIT